MTRDTTLDSPAQRRRRKARTHLLVRLAVQATFLVLAPSLFSGAFGGIRYLFAQIGEGQAVELSSLMAQLACLLGFTIVFGRFFCGFACTFGMLGDCVYAAGDAILRKTHVARPKLPERVVRVLGLLKYGWSPSTVGETAY